MTVYSVCASVANDEKKRCALTGEPLWDEMLFPDLKMPGKDVFEWLKAFKANESYKKVPVKIKHIKQKMCIIARSRAPQSFFRNDQNTLLFLKSYVEFYRTHDSWSSPYLFSFLSEPLPLSC